MFAVTLVRLQATAAAEETAAALEPRAFLMKVRADAVEGIRVPAREPANRFAALAERLTAQNRPAAVPNRRAPADQPQPQGAYVSDDTSSANARSRNARTDQGTEGETTDAASTGALWGAIEPCWRNLGFRGQVPVTIEVSLDGRGGLKGPPKVVRSASALLGEPRLKSEANALSALAACVPRGAPRMTEARYRLEFPATP